MRSGYHTVPSSIGHGLDAVRAAHQFRLVRRAGRIVGCWYTTDASFGPDGYGRRSPKTLRVNCRGMVRTADGRVAGVIENMAVRDDMAQHMLAVLSDAARQTLAASRREIAYAFVDNVRDAAWRVQDTSARAGTAWDATRIRYEMHQARLIDGYLGWDHRRDVAGTVATLETLTSARSALLKRFLDTLDPVLVGALRPHDLRAEMTPVLDGLLGEAWPSLDETFGRGAPLRETILPMVDDYARAERILHPFASWSRNHERYAAELEEEHRVMLARTQDPPSEVDLTDTLPPGLH